MTLQPETRFTCDRCFVDINVSLNDLPAQNRARPPEGWKTLWMDDVTLPAMHLCPDCAPRFAAFMGDEQPEGR